MQSNALWQGILYCYWQDFCDCVYRKLERKAKYDEIRRKYGMLIP